MAALTPSSKSTPADASFHLGLVVGVAASLWLAFVVYAVRALGWL